MTVRVGDGWRTLAVVALLAVGSTGSAAGGDRLADSGSAAVLGMRLAASPAPTPPDTLTVGKLTLHHCKTPAPWCGTLERPFDSTGTVPGTISIYFEFFPHTSTGRAQGTLVATEGGPGYAATDSRDEYLELFAPLREHRDVVLMDNRGTGRSAAIDCRPLQTDRTLTEANIGHCGDWLGPKAPLYSATAATDDLAAILDALGAGPIDLYGDSYGTFFEQVFAVRHPDKLRSLILDGAYPLDGTDYAWYPNYAPAMRAKFNLACQRSEACSALAGNSLEHIAPVLEQLRHQPIASARARDGEGRLRKFKADPAALATVMFGSAPAYASVRELDAAARAFVSGDRDPLLRLMAETQVEVDSHDSTKSPVIFSSGLAAAVTCEDAPQIFDMRLDPPQRRVSRDALMAQRRTAAADTYAPFTIDEFRGMPLDYTYLDLCVNWPAIEPQRYSAMMQLRTAPYPDVPALVISGDLDDITPVADGTLVAKRFRRGQQLLVPNGFHVNALRHSRSNCPAQIARHFIATLDVGDTSCLASIPEVRLVPVFARRIHELSAARPLIGNGAGELQLQIVAATVLTVGDVINRVGSNGTGKGIGLRGGSFDIAFRPDGSRLTLYEVRWAEDLGVSGKVLRPLREGPASAEVAVIGPAGNKGTLRILWTEGAQRARAQVTGELEGVRVVAETAAP